MSKPLGVDLSTSLHGLGVLAFHGPDAARFLQGQLSADVEKLKLGESTLAGLHNPQGRAIALLAVTRHSADEVFAVLPRELAAQVERHMRKYLLRAKLRIEDLSSAVTVLGSAANTAAIAGVIPIAWGARRLLLVRAERMEAFEVADAAALAAWNLADVVEGIPQIYATTSETFVAQMLNLDLLGAIAFDKGCYTGQEVIARAHYRGRVKRRMQRWHAMRTPLLEPGDAARAPDGRSLTVVRAVAAQDGGQELLAIGAFAPAAVNDTAMEVSTAGADSPGVQVNGPLLLPYSLPE
jgi:tRNA-modifying protein YgfZ